MKKLKMQLFGSFCLRYGEAIMGEEQLRSNKLTRILVYILMNRYSILTHQKLIEVFWEDDSRNPEGALKNAMYRLRNELKVLGTENFICTLPEAYRWNPEIEVESDYEELEAAQRMLKETDDLKQKKKLCGEIMECYKGNVSAKVAIESWMIPKVVWYQSVYMDAMKLYCKILAKEQQWGELEIICNRAIQEDPFDEDVHCWLLNSLHGQKKYDQVISQYEKTKKIFYENMGIKSPKKVSAVFQKILTDTGEEATDIEGLVGQLRELEKPTGSFFCDYQIFRQMYRIEARRIERLGVAEHLLLLTVRKKEPAQRGMIPEQVSQKDMDILERSIRFCLRTGDVASRYNATQFVILLPLCSYESGVKVAERIRDNFRMNAGKKGLEIVYELTDLSANS